MDPQEMLRQVTQKVNDANVALNGIRLEGEQELAKLDALAASKEMATADLESVQKELEGVNKEIAQATKDLTAIKNQIPDAREELEAIQKETDEEIEGKAKIIADIKATQDKIVADAQGKLADIKTEESVGQGILKELKSELATIMNDITEAKAIQASLGIQVQDAEDRLKKANRITEEIETKAVGLQVRVDTLADDVAAKEKDAATLSEEIEVKQAIHEDMEKRNEELKIELEKNNLRNVDFLKARQSVVDQQMANVRRTEYLKQKYGEFEENF